MSRVLVLGDYRQSLTIARSLAGRGDRVIGAIGPGRTSFLHRSRAVSDRWHPAHELGDERFEQELRSAIDRFGADVLFPVGDLEIAWVARDPDRFGVPVASVGDDIVGTCQDKPALLAVCDGVGVDHSASRVVETLDGLGRALDDIGFPAIVKSNDPLLRLLGSKGIVLHTPDDVDRVFGGWPDDHASLIVQRYVDGPRHNLYFVAERGEIAAVSEVEIIRTDVIDGTGYAVDGRTIPIRGDLLRDTERLVAELKYHGAGCTQFLVGADGETSFLELNPRLGANFAVVDRAGLHLAQHAVDIALGRPIRIESPRTGVRYAWTTGDLEGLVSAMRDRAVDSRGVLAWLWRAGVTVVRADLHVTWSWRDPWPALSTMWRSVVRPAVGVVFRRRSGR
jgi:predicted ATP-grasp superfamily ATP-dependent carboligase